MTDFEKKKKHYATPQKMKETIMRSVPSYLQLLDEQGQNVDNSTQLQWFVLHWTQPKSDCSINEALYFVNFLELLLLKSVDSQLTTP